MDKQFELIATVDGEVVGRATSKDVDDVIGQATTLDRMADEYIDEHWSEFMVGNDYAV